MSPVYIRVRVTKPDSKTGKTSNRYIVYYRRGGRDFPEEYAGSFKTQKEARLRRDFVAGELAAGRDPRAALEQLRTPPPAKPGLEQRWNEFIASRVDVGEKSRRGYRNARDRWILILGAARDPHTVATGDIIAGVAELYDGGDGLAPGTLSQYLTCLAQVLDFCDVEPNPARSSKVKLPAGNPAEKAIPSNEAWTLIKSKIRKRSLRPVRLMEACALRVSEACLLEVGDIDFVDGMVRIRREATKTDAGRRWVPVPPELLDELEAGLPPLEDRQPGQRVLGVKSTEVYYDLQRACTLAGIPEFGTHALRHRRISLWLRHGIDAVQVSRWSGHAKPSESTDTYGHTIADPRGDEWRDFWLDAYAGTRARVEEETL